MARHTKLKGILTGFTPIGLHLEFLYSHNHADLQVVKNIKNAVEVRHWPPEFVTLDGSRTTSWSSAGTSSASNEQIYNSTCDCTDCCSKMCCSTGMLQRFPIQQ